MRAEHAADEVLQASDLGNQRVVAVAAMASMLPVMLGGDGCRPVPLERWDVDSYRSGANKLETRFGAFVTAADSFDAAVFSISRRAHHALHTCKTCWQTRRHLAGATSSQSSTIAVISSRRESGGRCLH